MMKYVYAILFFFVHVTYAYAITDDIIVRQQVGIDADPPSTPTLISATPVSSSQIDLVWSASTDDFMVSGYKVFRDAAQIATTTQTTYSDTGLTASTTYTYYIQAFDTVPYVSTSSNSIATTTLAAPVTPPPDEDDGGAPDRLKLISLEIVSNTHSVEIFWKTNRHAQFQLRWGRTDSYELGFVTNNLFKREHNSLITDLEPGTVYEYELIGYDRDGEQIRLISDSFRTEEMPDDMPPSNVSNLVATVVGNNVVLTWDNPRDPDFSRVRVVRSHLFYPTDPYDGFVAYQGSRDEYNDANALSVYSVQYYTVFSYDREGNSSSGAVVRAVREREEIAEEEIASSTLQLRFEDFELVQNGKLISQQAVNADVPLLVRIAYDKLPEHLKTISVSLQHPIDTSLRFSFLLRINKDKTYYEAILAPLRTEGVYPVTYLVYDHEAKVMQELSGSYNVRRFKETNETFFSVPLSLGTQDLVERSSFLWLFLLILLLLLLFRLLHDIMLEKHPSAAFSTIRFSALLLCGFGAAVSAYIVLQSVSEVMHVANVSRSFIGGAVPLQTIERYAASVFILLLCIVLASAVVTYIRSRKKKSK